MNIINEGEIRLIGRRHAALKAEPTEQRRGGDPKRSHQTRAAAGHTAYNKGILYLPSTHCRRVYARPLGVEGGGVGQYRYIFTYQKSG